MSKPHDFYESLEMGVGWEKEFADRLESILITRGLEGVSFADDPAAQRDGIDLVLQQDRPTVDLKTRRHYALQFNDILLETWSVWEQRKRGWVFNEATDLVVYIFENRDGSDAEEGYFIALDDEFQEWFEAHEEDYPRKEADNSSFGGYTTVNRAVPMEEFPDGKLVPFDPSLPEPRETPQSKLDEWQDFFEGGDSA